MKKYLAMAAAMLMLLTACDNDKNEGKESTPTESVPAVTAESEIPQKTEVSEGNTTEAAATTAAEKTEDVTEAVTEDFTMPEDIPAFEEALDEQVLEAAQLLFEKACETEWNFTVGTPYAIDESRYIENGYGWRYYLVIEDGVNSVLDVKADYRKVFSKDFEDTIDELYMEQDGRVYCLNGARGSDIFYESSEVAEITGRDEGEIRFRVVDHYNHESLDQPYTEEREFVIVKEDGKWKVAKFKLPY